ncbi:MAG: DUF5131 family protein [Bacteroidota bacterium]
MANSKIEWTEKVWNITTGCNKVSAGCKNCYAECNAKRWWGDRKFTEIRYHPERLEQPYHWKKPAKIFVDSMSDLFHSKINDEILKKIFKVIEENERHTFIILTKRPENMQHFMRKYYPVPLQNVWLGVSVEDQQSYMHRGMILKNTPAAIRFLSCEPLLENVNLNCSYLSGNDSLHHFSARNWDWVIVGAESGTGRRYCELEWICGIVADCKMANFDPSLVDSAEQPAGTPVFVKQYHQMLHPQKMYVCRELLHFPKEIAYREFPVGGDK